MANLPVGEMTGPAAWLGPDMSADTDRWKSDLSQNQIEELSTAADHFLSLGKDVGEITADTFPLPNFGQELAQLKDKLVNGCGVQLYRGLPVQRYSQKKAAAIFCGIGAHLGSARSQNAAGHILGHVRDLGADPEDVNTRIYQTNARQSFHTDSADLVGLMCLQDAIEGGDSLLVSAHSIYNRMKSERPDLLELLFEPIATDRRGEVPEGMLPYMTIPVFSWHKSFLTVFYQRQYIDSAQRFSDAPQLTEKHVEALDMFDALANDPTLNFSMRLQPGDMQFVYNHNQLHDRTGFRDHPERNKRRHLFRLWLSLDNDRPLPDVFKERYGSIEIGNRGGIVTKETVLKAPLDVS